MRNIVLFCAAGMSTSMLVAKMREAAAAENYECTIDAFAMGQVAEKGGTADVIFVGPQVRLQLDSIKKQHPDKPAEVIDMRAYGMMDGKAIIKRAKEILGD